MSKGRVFYSKANDRIYFVTQNMCGCCPCNLIVEWGRGFTHKISIDFKNDVEIEEYLEKWIEL